MAQRRVADNDEPMDDTPAVGQVRPMFPLQTVLLPAMVLPLQIFEPRYRVMIGRCLEGDRCFGVPLIERGREVGGGDERSDIGTLAQVVGASELPDGRWYLLIMGTKRFRVLRWLEDDPYPQAEIEEWDDAPELPVADSERYAALVGAARRLLAMAVEAGITAEVTTDFADDPALGTFQVAGALPLGPFDRQKVLATRSSGDRLALLEDLCRDSSADLERMLTMRSGGEDDPAF